MGLLTKRTFSTGRQAYVDQGISLAASLGLQGLEIFDVAVEEDGSWTWHVICAGDRAVCCPDCGQVSGSPVEPVIQQVKHLVVVPVRVAWHKARFRCDAVGCARVRFTQTGRLTVPDGRVSTHARQMMGHLVGDWLVPVSRVAAGAGVAWHTAHEGFEQVAADASIVVTDTKTGTKTDPGDRGRRGCDQHRWQRSERYGAGVGRSGDPVGEWDPAAGDGAGHR
jgi:transposase